MGNLKASVRNIKINDRNSLSDFKDNVVKRNLNKGVFIGSIKYRNRNLMNNYEFGGSFRTKRSDLWLNGYDYFQSFDPKYKIMRTSYLNSTGVGEYADIIQDNNSELRFTTTKDFLIFQENIRSLYIDAVKARKTAETDYSRLNDKWVKNYMAEFSPTYNENSVLSKYEYGDAVSFDYLLSSVQEKLTIGSRVFKPSEIIRKEVLKKYFTDKVKAGDIYATLEELNLEFTPDESKLRSIEEKSTYIPKETAFGSTTPFNGNTDITGRMYNSFYEENGVSAIGKQETAFNTLVRIDGFHGVSNLLKKTNEIFKEKKTNTLINRFSTGKLVNRNGELETSFSEYGLSRGRNLLTKELSKHANDTGFENPYCRVWTAAHQYSKLKHRIRPFYDDDGNVLTIKNLQSNYGNLRPRNGNERLENNTVLKDNGFVRISSEHKENSSQYNEIKRYMFSIENLAWRDSYGSLSKEQLGPNYGRIMWFPPYNLKFTENVNVEWNSHKFIGRGEQIYTYTNTDRSGTLSFTLLIDHPSILNKWRTTSKEYEITQEEDLLRFFAGCGVLNGNVTGKPDEILSNPPEKKPSLDPKPGQNTTTYAYVMFFPNNYAGLIDGENPLKALERLEEYENQTTSQEIKPFEVDTSYKNETKWSGNTCEYRLNYELSETAETKVREMLGLKKEDGVVEIIPIFNPNSGYTKLNELITNETLFGNPKGNSKISQIRVKGYATSHGVPKNNEGLSKRRSEMIEKVMKMSNELSEMKFVTIENAIVPMPENKTNETINELPAKIGRSAVALIDVVWDKESKPTNNVTTESGEVVMADNQQLEQEQPEQEPANTNMASSTVAVDNDPYKYDNEYLYFSCVKDDEMVYKNIMDKVRFFDPAFHSITPEGFNSRLTFLQQCTRQGPTTSISGGKVNSGSEAYLRYAGNLAFGRAPYCVLRIGDFFNTKICITSLSIDYDNGGGPQWDLNPEGAGVQPMFANININFNFIGGQDIEGPVARLQNAISHNYYANTSIYDPKSNFGKNSRQ